MGNHPDADCELSLTNSKLVAIVDADDFDKLSKRKWYLTPDGYAQATDHSYPRYMHTAITGFDETDHDNQNRLDNRKFNLVSVSRSQNRQRGRKRANTTSGFRGVYRNTRNKWTAQININGKPRSLGSFSKEVDAAKAYDVAARIYYGNRAATNF